jgi:HEAT repeat protein
VVFAAARALYRLDPAQGRPVLVSILEKETAAKSSFFRGQLRTMLRRMKTPRSALVFAAQQGAGFLPVPGLGAGLSAMNSMLLDADFSARAYALTMIAGERNDRTTELLAEGLKDEDWSVRAAAVQAIATGGRTNLRDELGPLFADRDRKVRYRAAAAYVRLRYVTAPKR